MKPQGDGEQPAHCRIEAMKSPEPREREPWPGLGGDGVHGSLSDLWRLRKCSACRLRSIPIWLRHAFVRRAMNGLALLRIAIRVRRTVAALEAHLVRPVRCRPVHKEFGIEGDAAFRIGVELDHPSLDAIRIELRIDRAV